jgi:hypothetical protein
MELILLFIVPVLFPLHRFSSFKLPLDIILPSFGNLLALLGPRSKNFVHIRV